MSANAPLFINDPQDQLEEYDSDTIHKTHTAKMTASDKVLVYHHRHNASNPIISNGLAVITTSELDNILQNRKFFPQT